MSCFQILNDYDGVQHDYTLKQGLVWQQVFLPEHAPQEWQERNIMSETGILYRMNCSVQVKGAFGVLKITMNSKDFYCVGKRK